MDGRRNIMKQETRIYLWTDVGIIYNKSLRQEYRGTEEYMIRSTPEPEPWG